MNGFKEILQAHIKRYQLIEPCDAVKLIYQSCFGPGHMISDENAALERIRSEHSSCGRRSDHMCTESLGEVSRIYLDCEYTEDELQVIAKMFFASASYFNKGYEFAEETVKTKFETRIGILKELCHEGKLPFGEETLNAYLESYRKAVFPAVSHSESYRKAYSPSYRVVDSRYIPLIPCILKIAKAISVGGNVILAIDGRCASGKTTAAKLISDIFHAETVHMDDFFLPPELRSKERLAEIGGNIHRERFISEVIPYIRNKDGFAYRKFDCSRFAYADLPVEINPSPLIICEGSYALHPSFGKYYDIAVFSDVPSDEQLRRIKERNGEYMLSRFKNEWIPMEESYFEAYGIKDKCDLVI